MGSPAADVEVTPALVRQLLRDQHPDLADDPLRLVGEGWDNVTFRLGRGLAVRVPRRQLAAELLTHEQRWLPVLGPRLPLPIPNPVRIGAPSRHYPWPWSIVEWLGGTTADRAPLGADQASRLARFLEQLHRPAPAEAPTNPFRGCRLDHRREAVETRLGLLDADPPMRAALMHIWDEALAAAPAGERRWIHGDMHPMNVLVEHGMVTGVIDWGDLAGGDPATDLAAAWTLIESPSARADFLETYQPAPDLVSRARGWAVVLASALADSGQSRHAGVGHAILARLAQRPPSG